MKEIINKKQWKILKKALLIYWKDLVDYHQGWFYFGVRLILNAFWLWLFFSFIWSWYHFVFGSFGIDAEKIDTIRTILYAIGVLFLVMKGFAFYDLRRE
jgi:hypothetical protein